MIQIINGDCLKVLRSGAIPKVDCIFADPPDNIGLDYGNYCQDELDIEDYYHEMSGWFHTFLAMADCVWMSFNARHLPAMGSLTASFMNSRHGREWDFKPCVQTFTFGNHNRFDLTNNYRPLWRWKAKYHSIYPDVIKIQSERQKAGDKRAKPGGKVPGDVFEFPRVTGNSKQRRKWHPTQLNEDLVERCILLTTKEGDHVLDPFGGTGTTARVCRRLNRDCTIIEISPEYCTRMEQDLGL